MPPATVGPAGVDAEVGIVGYGPVGATLAILVAQLGHTVVVAERWPAPYPLPRAVHLDHEAARILQGCGIGDELEGIGEVAPVYEWRNAAGTTLLRFGRHGDGASGWPESLMFHQPGLESLLDGRAGGLPAIDVRRGVEVTGVEQTSDAVVLRTSSGTDLTARYVVGCDGANSTVRDALGIRQVDHGYFHDWLIVDVVLDEPRVFDPINVQICDPSRPTTAVSGGPGRRRWEFMRLPHESLADLDDDAAAWDLLARWGVDPGNASLERRAVYTFGARHAEAWRAGRVLLAGDAAHLMPPFAGQGVCAGIRDAANLAWKLDLALRGSAGPALLDTYEQERLPDALGAIDFSIELGKVICVADPDEAAARDEAMAAVVGADLTEVPPPPPIGSGLVLTGSPWAGHLFVQGRVGGRRADDAHGAGWRLFVLGAGTVPVDPAIGAWFGSIGGKVVTLTDPHPVYLRWFAGHDCTVALQRPDFHLFGTASSADRAAALLEGLRARLGADVVHGD